MSFSRVIVLILFMCKYTTYPTYFSTLRVYSTQYFTCAYADSLLWFFFACHFHKFILYYKYFPQQSIWEYCQRSSFCASAQSVPLTLRFASSPEGLSLHCVQFPVSETLSLKTGIFTVSEFNVSL